MSERLSDETLMERYKRGDSGAFEALYERYKDRIYGYLSARITEPSKVNDVFQNTFLKLHKSRSRYKSSFPFKAWIFIICRTVLIDWFRKQGRTPEIPVEEVPTTPPQTTTEPETPDLASLPARQKEAVELRYYEELSFEEIAQRLETSPLNVRQIISRAIRRLRNHNK